MGRKLGKKKDNPSGLVFPSNKVEVQPYHPFVCTPGYDGKVDTDFALSLAEAAFCCPLFQVQITSSIVANSAFIELARNMFVKWFLEEQKDCTHLFFIDSDLKFPANAFIGLARSGLPICAGAYRRRQDEVDYPVKWAHHPEVGGLWVEDDWVMAERVPTGFLCIERSIIEAMAADARKLQIHVKGEWVEIPELFYTSITEDDPPRFKGEDFSFCDDYRERYGVPIPVWPNIDFVHGGYECNLSDYLEEKLKEEEEECTTSIA
jgi:hypothetical protein